MVGYVRIFLGIFVFSMLLGCNAYKNQNADQAARCKEMKHRLVFDGSSLNDSHSNTESDNWQQRAGLIRLNEDYNESCAT